MSLTVILTKRPGKKSHVKLSSDSPAAAFPRGGWGLHCRCLTTGISRKRASSRVSMDPSSNVVPSVLLFTFLPPCLIYFAFPSPHFSLQILFCSVWIFFPPRIFLICLFYSFLCILNVLQLFLLNISLMTVFTPHTLCMGSYKYGEKPRAVSTAWMHSPSLVMF